MLVYLGFRNLKYIAKVVLGEKSESLESRAEKSQFLKIKFYPG